MTTGPGTLVEGNQAAAAVLAAPLVTESIVNAQPAVDEDAVLPRTNAPIGKLEPSAAAMVKADAEALEFEQQQLRLHPPVPGALVVVPNLSLAIAVKIDEKDQLGTPVFISNKAAATIVVDDGPMPNMEFAELGPSSSARCTTKRSRDDSQIVTCSPTPYCCSSVGNSTPGRTHSKLGCKIREPDEVLSQVQFFCSKNNLAAHYRRDAKIGEGTYGTVHVGESLDGKRRKVAIKRLKPLGSGMEGFPRTSIREVMILKHIQKACKNVVDRRRFTLIDDIVLEGDGSPDVNLIFEFFDHDVQGLIMRREITFTEEEMRFVVRQVLQALSILHEARIIHRDIKPDNLLVRRDGSIAVGDFGLALPINADRASLTPRMISLSYRPPEMLLGSVTYTEKVDIWSVGVLFTHLIMKEPIFHGSNHGSTSGADSELTQLERITQALGPITEMPSQIDCPAYNKMMANPRAIHSKGEGITITLWEWISNKCKQKGVPVPSDKSFEVMRDIFQLNPSSRPTAKELLKKPAFFMSAEYEKKFAADFAKRLANLPQSHQMGVREQRAAQRR